MSARYKRSVAVAAAANKQLMLPAMEQKTLRALLAMVGMIALKAVKAFYAQQVHNLLQSRTMKAARRMSAQRYASGTMNRRNNLADCGEGRKAKVMLRRKNPLKKIIHACAQALINQVRLRSPATAPPVIGITRKLCLIHIPALACQKADAVHVLLLQQSLIMTHQLH